MSDELAEGPDFRLRAGAHPVELLRKFRRGTRNFIAVTHIEILKECGKRRLRLVLCGGGSRQDQTEQGSRDHLVHKIPSDCKYTPAEWLCHGAGWKPALQKTNEGAQARMLVTQAHLPRSP